MGRLLSPGIVSCNIKEANALAYTSLGNSSASNALDVLGRVVFKIKIDRTGASYRDQEGQITKC